MLQLCQRGTGGEPLLQRVRWRLSPVLLLLLLLRGGLLQRFSLHCSRHIAPSSRSNRETAGRAAAVQGSLGKLLSLLLLRRQGPMLLLLLLLLLPEQQQLLLRAVVGLQLRAC